MLRLAVEMGPKIGKALWEGIKAALSGGASFDPAALLGDMAEAGIRGFEGDSLADFFGDQMSSATQEQAQHVKELFRELQELQQRAREEATKTVQQGSKAPIKRKLDIEVGKMSLPTGFLDIVEANRKVQESLLKDQDPTVELVGVAKVGNQMQQKLINGVEKLVALTERNTEVRPQVATL